MNLNPDTVNIAIKMLTVGVKLAGAANRALDASQNGDDEAAREYLGQARASYEKAREMWDASDIPDPE